MASSHQICVRGLTTGRAIMATGPASVSSWILRPPSAFPGCSRGMLGVSWLSSFSGAHSGLPRCHPRLPQPQQPSRGRASSFTGGFVCFSSNSVSNQASSGSVQSQGASGVSLSHVDHMTGLPRMVDVSAKAVTTRRARAQCVVRLPAAVDQWVSSDGKELLSKKGPVLTTAVIAGTQAVKRTHELLPFCHPLPIESCRFEMELQRSSNNDTDATVEEDQQGGPSSSNTNISGWSLRIMCEVAATHRTGVEMEALTGASVAGLAVYDMCKALGHEMVIEETRLLSKTGGKSDFFGVAQQSNKPPNANGGDACDGNDARSQQ